MPIPFESRSNRLVANWLLLGVFMLCVQVILGGITRLTGSGLSITEWNVVTGAFPPLNQQQWTEAFEKYRQTQQYRILHADFQLSDFKFIFFWEWFHRLWARLVGVAFLVGLGWLLWKKHLHAALVKPLLLLFLLGGLQGAVGWIMVASGLVGDAIYVQPAKLAMHFIFALILISFTLWFALSLLVPPQKLVKDSRLRGWTWATVCLLFFQLVFGALMAGHKAANAAPTWPSLNGAWLPTTASGQPFTLRGLIENKIYVQFMHRSLAYLLLILIICWTVRAAGIIRRSGQPWFSKWIWFPVCILGLQILLGIFSLLSSTGIVPDRWVLFDWMAQLHQITGMLFLLLMVFMLFVVRSGALQAKNAS